jgi:activator of 2-hydroxyglutaryl-CoA dehydratase
MYKIGIDIGSVSVNLAVIDEKGGIVEDIYLRHKGRSLEVAREAVDNLIKGLWP